MRKNWKHKIKDIPPRYLLESALEMLYKLLPLWTDFHKSNEIIYVESVAGSVHNVSPNLLLNCIELGEKHSKQPSFWYKQWLAIKWNSLNSKISNHMCSIADEDVEMPYLVQQIIYALSALIDALQKEVTEEKRMKFLFEIILISGELLEEEQAETSSSLTLWIDKKIKT